MREVKEYESMKDYSWRQCLQYSFLFLFLSLFGTSTFHGYLVSWRFGEEGIGDEANVLDMS